MSGLCGWHCPKRTGAADPEVIASMAAAISRFDAGAVRSASTGFGAVAVMATAGNADIFQNDEQLVAVWGRAHFTDAEYAELAQRNGIAQALAQGYARKSTAIFAALSGSFALAIVDGHSGEAVLAIDRMGVHSVTYTITGEGLVFGSSADAINRHPGVTPELNRQAIYDYLYFHMVPGPATVCRGQQRLLPGHFLRFVNGNTETSPYWRMQFEEDVQRPFAELKQEFLECLRNSVRSAAGASEAGAFLSGGTDSSTIAGVLGEVRGEPARTFSIGFEAEGYDEMDYARIAARHFKTRHHEYYVTPDDITDAIPRIAAIYDQPFGNSSAVPTYYCAKLAKSHGIERLLGGDGGDELFGGNSRYALQHIFSLYKHIPAPLRRLLIEPLVNGIPAGEHITLIRKARGYIRQASVPMPARLETYNLLERFGPERVFTADFLQGVDRQQPLALLNAVYNSARAGTLINRMLALDFQFTLADNDLPKVTRTCELAQVDVAFPLLDDAMVAFSARLAPRLKLKGTTLRYFFKEALRGFLPDATISKKKHGFGLPFGIWLQTHRPLQDLVYGSLTDLKKRGIVRADFLDELTSVRVAEHPGYYGTMVWVLMMLEQWLQHHPDRRLA